MGCRPMFDVTAFDVTAGREDQGRSRVPQLGRRPARDLGDHLCHCPFNRYRVQAVSAARCRADKLTIGVSISRARRATHAILADKANGLTGISARASEGRSFNTSATGFNAPSTVGRTTVRAREILQDALSNAFDRRLGVVPLQRSLTEPKVRWESCARFVHRKTFGSETRAAITLKRGAMQGPRSVRRKKS